MTPMQSTPHFVTVVRDEVITLPSCALEAGVGEEAGA